MTDFQAPSLNIWDLTVQKVEKTSNKLALKPSLPITY